MPANSTPCNPNFRHEQEGHRVEADSGFPGEWYHGLAAEIEAAGRPDFVFLKLKTAVFVDGCFWHGCPKHGAKPKTNAAFWRKKIETNRACDKRVNRLLRQRGWTVLRVWEHALARKHEGRLLRRLESLRPMPQTDRPRPERKRCSATF